MKLTNEQIEQILDGAPEGTTHYETRNRQYFKRDGNTDRLSVWISATKAWSVPLESKSRWLERLERIREILNLRKRVEDLEIAIEQSLEDIEYAAFNLCETVDLASRCKGRVVESTCPETSLLIAIRDMKEALTPPKEQDDE